MVKLTIDGISVSVENGTSLLKAAASVGIGIPHLCYFEGLNEIGACRVCVVEIEGVERLAPACETLAEDGMVVYTNSPRVREARKTNVELIMSQHDGQCMSCVRNGSCALQSLCEDLGVVALPYRKALPCDPWNQTLELIRDNTKCIKCMRCIQVCDHIQNVKIWDVEGTGGYTRVAVHLNKSLYEAGCTLCGQCITHCPVGALSERDDTDRVYAALKNPEITTIVQVAPAVRAAWGEDFGMTAEIATEKRMVSALKKLGFNYVFDTDLAADMTIMEEASEFLEQMKHPDKHKKPMFTSCCPGWVRFVKAHYPEFTEQLSTTKSPHQMFGAILKTYFAEQLGADPEKIFVVSIMPCLAKKAESAIPNQNDAVGHRPDVDAVLTVREMNRMLKADHILPGLLPEAEFDQPLGTASGAGVIFGATGGVMEAALRTAYHAMTGHNPEPDAFKNVRGLDGWKEAALDINGRTVRVAVASGLGNTRKLLEALKAGTVSYDFVEIMACPGGCSGGGGMPIHDGYYMTSERSDTLYGLDQSAKIRFSHENPAVRMLYDEYFGKPLSEKAEQLLHTDHFGWEV